MHTKTALVIKHLGKISAQIADLVGIVTWVYYAYSFGAAVYRDCCAGLNLLNTQTCLIEISCTLAFGEFGTMVGTLVGTYYLPGIGSMCGPFVGGTTGSYIGGKVAKKIGNYMRAKQKPIKL